MKILNNTDWYNDQLFHYYYGTYTYTCFLEWLFTILNKGQINVLLINEKSLTYSTLQDYKKKPYPHLNRPLRTNNHLQVIIAHLRNKIVYYHFY